MIFKTEITPIREREKTVENADTVQKSINWADTRRISI